MSDAPQDLISEIKQLISLQCEGEYWDFKREWHHNKAELLHDILCLANSRYIGNKFLIFGVGESNTKKHFAVCGVKVRDKNRKDTKDLDDFLSARDFVGGLRPLVHVERIKINRKQVDVVIIEPSNNVPFVLASDYLDQPEKEAPKTIRCGNLYTRVADKNTPINKTADNDIAELLWRRRFRIDATPLDKLVSYLSSPDDWPPLNAGLENEFAYYYKYDPEYRLYFSLEETSEEDFLGKNWIVGTANYSTIKFMLYDTVIEIYEYNSANKLEYSFIRPLFVPLGETYVEPLMMAYYIEGSPQHCLSNFIREKFMNQLTGFREEDPLREQNIIVFQSEEEKEEFTKYAKEIACSFILPQIWSLVDENKGPKWDREDYTDWVSTKVLKTVYIGWKNNH